MPTPADADGTDQVLSLFSFSPSVAKWNGNGLCSRSPSGRGIRFKPGQGRVRIPLGVQALVPERNMDPAKDRRFAGSNPARGIYALIAEWNRLTAQDRWIPERDVPGSNPGGRMLKDSLQAARKGGNDHAMH